MNKPRHPQTTKESVFACSDWYQAGLSCVQCSSHRLTATWKKKEQREIAELAHEAKILVMQRLWLQGRKKQKSGEDKETAREADTDTAFQSSLRTPANYLEISRERIPLWCMTLIAWPWPTSVIHGDATLILWAWSLCVIFTMPHSSEEEKRGLNIVNRVRKI